MTTLSSLLLFSSILLAVFMSGCAGSAGSASPTLTNEVFPADLPVIQPPFRKNKKFLIGQGFHGGFSHQDLSNAYAVDLTMREGEPVCAVKSGVVESYKDVDQIMSGNERFREGNFVRILHKDGTRGFYGHLAPNSITVKKSQIVKQGECFAGVGDTGYSTAPHLHFSLLKLEQTPHRLISIPFRFKQHNGQATIPQYLQWVKN